MGSLWRIHRSCTLASTNAQVDLYNYDQKAEFEILDRDATAQTTNVQLRLPLKYTGIILALLLKDSC